MMKKQKNNFTQQISSNLSKTVAAMALVASVATPNLVSAQTQGDVKTVTTTDVNNFCAKISNLADKIGRGLSDRMGNYETRKQDRISKVKNRQADRNKKITDKRSDWDKERGEHFAELKLKAKTEAQIDAVSAYESNIQAAVTAKRAKVDAAIKTYNDGINSLLNTRVDNLDGSVDSFKAKIDAAVAEAKNTCANGGDPAEAQAKLKATIELNTKSLLGSTKVLPEVKTAIEKLQSDRKAAVSVAEMDFKKAIEAARADLKVAFK